MIISDHFINSHNHFSRQNMDIVRRKLILVTIGTQIDCDLKGEVSNVSVCMHVDKLSIISPSIEMILYNDIRIFAFPLYPYYQELITNLLLLLFKKVREGPFFEGEGGEGCLHDRDLKIRRRQRERHKSTRFNQQNNNFARASRFFVHFFAVTARLRRENA